MMETIWRPLRYQLGAEELIELGRPVRMYRYAHTPFLAGRAEVPRGEVSGDLYRAPENLYRGMGQAPPAQVEDSTLKKLLIIGVPIVVVAGFLALT